MGVGVGSHGVEPLVGVFPLMISYLCFTDVGG